MYDAAAAAAKSLQSCLTLCDPIDGSPPDFPVPGIPQARTPEWVAISFCNAWKWKVKMKSLSCVWLLATPWTTAYQASPSIAFSRLEYGACQSPGDEPFSQEAHNPRRKKSHPMEKPPPPGKNICTSGLEGTLDTWKTLLALSPS